MYEVILAAVDGSARSGGVLATAMAVAERFGGRVHLFRAVDVPVEIPPAAATHPDPVPAMLGTQAREALAALARGREQVVIEEPDLSDRHPWRSILAAAARIGAQLIVVGSHGFAGWDRLVGTNAAKVADHARCHVLVVHEPSGA
jgi:nucleotide-binding universal stress UspA family protein